MTTNLRKKVAWSLSLAVVLALLVAPLALADNLIGDGDGVIPLENDPNISFGMVCRGQTYPADVLLGINKVGGGNVYANGAAVTVSSGTVTGTGVSVSIGDSSIDLPSDWTSLGNNTLSTSVSSNGSALSTVTLIPPLAETSGAKIGSVVFSAIGAKNGGGSLTRSVTVTLSWMVIDCDSDAPLVTVTFPTPDGLNDWLVTKPVMGTVTASDGSNVSEITCTGATLENVTGLGSGNASGDLEVTDEGINTISCSATDGLGNSGAAPGSSNTAEVKIDTVAPTVTLTPDRSPDFNGWYTQTVNFTVGGNDPIPGSGLDTCDASIVYNGPDNATASVSGNCNDFAGNIGSSSSGDFQYDATAPTDVQLTAYGTPGTNNWFIGDVTIKTTGSDDVSGVTCTDDQYQTDETTGATFNGSCTNGAGMTTNAAPLTIKLDKTGPSAVLAVTAGTAGANGWYTSDVTVSTSGSDDISSPVTCTADQYQTAETTGTDFNGSCTNDAGLTTNVSPLTVKLDKTGPSAQLTPYGTLGNAGWYVSDVTIKTTGSDTISDPTTCTADQFQSTDTAGATFNGSCTNEAGLSTDAEPLTIKRDAIPPSLAWNGGPASGGVYYFSFVPAAPTCTASDSLSGPDGCTVSGYSTSVGIHTMTATAYDVAGNSFSDQRTYEVKAWTLSGFYSPVDMNSVWNTVKNGSTVPLKFEIFAGSTELTDISYIVQPLTAKQVSCLGGTEDQIELTATGSTTLRYDTSGGQYIYNWQTPKKPGFCYTVTVTTLDGSSLVAYFKLK